MFKYKKFFAAIALMAAQISTTYGMKHILPGAQTPPPTKYSIVLQHLRRRVPVVEKFQGAFEFLQSKKKRQYFNEKEEEYKAIVRETKANIIELVRSLQIDHLPYKERTKLLRIYKKETRPIFSESDRAFTYKNIFMTWRKKAEKEISKLTKKERKAGKLEEKFRNATEEFNELPQKVHEIHRKAALTVLKEAQKIVGKRSVNLEKHKEKEQSEGLTFKETEEGVIDGLLSMRLETSKKQLRIAIDVYNKLVQDITAEPRHEPSR